MSEGLAGSLASPETQAMLSLLTEEELETVERLYRVAARRLAMIEAWQAEHEPQGRPAPGATGSRQA